MTVRPCLRCSDIARRGRGAICDIVSETSVDLFAAEILYAISKRSMCSLTPTGSGFERTLGMYRLSNALLPALKNNQGRTFILNVPPAEHAVGRRIVHAQCAGLSGGCAERFESETRASLVRLRDRRVRQQAADRNHSGRCPRRILKPPALNASARDRRRLAGDTDRVADLFLQVSGSAQRCCWLNAGKAGRPPRLIIGQGFCAGRRACVPLSRAGELKEPA